MKKILIISILSAVFATAHECGDAEIQADLNACMTAEYENADKALNAVYSSYRAVLNNSQKATPKNAQAAWIEYKDLSCSFESSAAEGESIRLIIFNQCLTKKTKIRTEEIKELLSYREGDLACPMSGK
ncbi:MAG: lysozyme inhibitor LprI family protein [Campylobacteraceae bacterium]|jgi:uncharacterized protein YecT (DUF1311 family)|nr:lysozyme inhibitor LprI family protein [Campylobacteraceae bacterium]